MGKQVIYIILLLTVRLTNFRNVRDFPLKIEESYIMEHGLDLLEFHKQYAHKANTNIL